MSFLFFFSSRRRHTRCSRDWSSDVCSSDLRKDRIVSRMTSGVAGLFKKNKITWLQGHGKLVSGGTSWKIQIDSETVEAKNVIIATGSKARHLPGVAVDNKIICDSEGALAFDSVPERLGVIGAGVIGLELGSVWRRLGAKGKVLEALPAVLGAADEAVAHEAWKQFTKNQGLEIELGVAISKVIQSKKYVSIQYTGSDNSSKSLECDRLIVSVGRVPNRSEERRVGKECRSRWSPYH